MKILGQIVSVQSLALIISLPNQLFAHVPITNISSQLTKILEDMDNFEGSEPEEDDETQSHESRIPTLFDLFKEGQYIRSIVVAVHTPGSTDTSGVSKSRDEVAKASRRIELSLVPEKVNAGVQKLDLRPDFASTSFR
jgi:rRNA biogenesis protein RRP5